MHNNIQSGVSACTYYKRDIFFFRRVGINIIYSINPVLSRNFSSGRISAL